jgi:hypothetical protein
MACELVTQVQVKTDEYVRKGGKRSRKDRRAVMLAFAAHAAGLGARQMGQVGATHVVRYWKAHRGLKDATLANHWYALCELWELFDKPSKPPKPWKKEHEGMGATPP